MTQERNAALPDGREALSPGTILKERYVIDSLVGCGGFAVTYSAWDPVLDCTVAVKEYRKGLDRFLEEARVMARFRSCRNMIYVYDFFREGSAAYIIMEYLRGETLKQRLLREERLEPEEAVRIMKAVLNCLSEIHGKGLVHRDVAPDNIYLCEDGTVKLFDFGSARNIGSKSRDVEIKKGYSPPEQYDPEKKAEETSDVYSAAAVFYRMLTGRVPPPSIDRIREDTVSFLGNRDEGIPEDLKQVILKGLALRPEQRIATAGGFLQQITESSKAGKRSRKRAGNSRRSICAAVLFLLLAAAVITGGNHLSEKEKISSAAVAVPAEISMNDSVSGAAEKEPEKQLEKESVKETENNNVKETETETAKTEEQEPVSETVRMELIETEAEQETVFAEEKEQKQQETTAASEQYGMTAAYEKESEKESEKEGEKENRPAGDTGPEPTVPDLSGW